MKFMEGSYLKIYSTVNTEKSFKINEKPENFLHLKQGSAFSV